MSEEYIMAFGAIPSSVDVRDYKLKEVACAQTFPESFELQMGSVKNQGSVGSCVAHALAETIEYHDHRQNNRDEQMSVGFIYGNRRNTSYKGVGMPVREAIASVVSYGNATKLQFNHNVEVPKAIELFEQNVDTLRNTAYPNRFSSYFRVSTVNEIKTALMNYGPVVFAINWYDDITLDRNFIMHSSCDPKKTSGAHCMVIYGWDKNGWKIMNSWGIFWGNKGKAILPFDFKLNEAWGITDDVTGEDLETPFDNKFGQFVAKIINAILNIFKR